jgi:hypothetical protein
MTNGSYSWDMTLEAVSKRWIRVQGKSQIPSLPSGARGGEKVRHTRVVCEHFELTRNTAMGP